MSRKPSRPGAKLTTQQVLFCQEYVKDHNATKAAIRAGYSPQTARVQGSRLLTKDAVMARVQEFADTQLARVRIDADRVLEEVYRIATSDIGQAYGPDGEMLSVPEMPEEFRRTLSGVEVEELFDYERGGKKQIGNTRKIKNWDKMKALELLGKHLGIFKEKIEVEGKLTLEQLILQSNEETPENESDSPPAPKKETV